MNSQTTGCVAYLLCCKSNKAPFKINPIKKYEEDLKTNESTPEKITNPLKEKKAV